MAGSAQHKLKQKTRKEAEKPKVEDVMAKVLSKYKKLDPSATVPAASAAVSKPAAPAASAVKAAAVKAGADVSQSKQSLAQSDEASEFMANSEDKSQVDGGSQSENDLEQQIEIQAKAIEQQQLKDQQKAVASGKLKISSAAAALNNAEMGIENKEESTEDLSTPLGISSDQLYTNFEHDEKDKKQSLGQTTNESSTIVRAKQAANQFVDAHPEALFENKKTSALKENAEKYPNKNEAGDDKTEKAADKATVEIEQTADLESFGTGFDNGEKLEGADNDEKFMIAEENQQSQDELAAPQWPKYDNPVTQKADIEAEFAQVKKTAAHWKQLYDDAQKTQKDENRFEGLAEQKKKQKDIDLQQNITVDKIKLDIWNDRQTFLQQILDLDEGSLKDKEFTMESEDVNRGGKKSGKKSSEIHAKSFEELKQFGKSKSHSRKSKHHEDDDAEDLSDDEERAEHHGHHKDNDDEHDTDDFIDEDKSKYTSNKHHIHKELERGNKHSGKHVIKYSNHDDDVDEDDEANEKHHDSAEPEDFNGQIKKETENLAELTQKAEQLVAAQKDVEKAQGSIGDERTSLDEVIKGQIAEREAMQKVFGKRAKKRQEAERKAAEEREKAEEKARQAEKEQRLLALKQTEEIEQKARALHKKEQELKKDRHLVQDSLAEVKDEMDKIKEQIQHVQDKKREHLVYKRREAFRKQYEENREAKIKAREEEEARRKHLANSCKPSKVRTYACNRSGRRNIKYFNYKYDFDQDKCVEKVKRVTVKCKEVINDDDEDEIDDVKPRRSSKKRSVRSNRKGVHADDYASHSQKAQKGKKVVLAHTEGAEEEADRAAEPEPAAEQDEAEESHVSFATKKQQRKIDSSAKQIKKLTQHIGEIEGKVSEVTTKYGEMKKKLAAAEAAAKKAAEEKAAAEAAAKKKEEEEAAAAEKAKEGEAKVQKGSSTDETKNSPEAEAEADSDVKIDIQNPEDKDQNIEDKDDRISADKIAAVQISSELTQNDEAQNKIEKFASMLRTLSKAKKEYKASNTSEQKDKIHNQIASYTQKWLDAKNLQLFNTIQFKEKSAEK